MTGNAYKSLLDTVFLGCKGLRVLISLACYGDESGIHDGAPVFVMAGWVAPQDEWTVFDQRWRATLRNAGVPSNKGYHATDCESGYGLFAGWSVDKRTALTIALIDIIRSTNTVGSGVIINRVVPTNASAGARWFSIEPYTAAIPLFLTLMTQKASMFLDAAARIAFVLDRQKDYAASSVANFNAMRDDPISGLNPIQERAGTLVFGDSVEHTPLQAADLLAFELRKEYEATRDANPRPERRSLVRLKSGNQISQMDITDEAAGLDFLLRHTYVRKGGINIRLGRKPGSPKIFIPRVPDEPEES